MSENDEDDPKSLPWTGERYVPGVNGNIALEHLHRYIMARELAYGKTVLDIACGEGYGSAYIAEVAGHVIGVDISPEAIQHAIQKYRRRNLEFRIGSCAQIPLAEHSIDIVVSFETIEHHDQHNEMMSEIKRVLRPDGVIIISSPEKHAYSIVSNYQNPFHVKELYRDEFEILMMRYFRHVAMYGQRVIYGSAIFRENSGGPIGTYETIEGAPVSIPGMHRPIYIIAVGSDVELPIASSSLFEREVTRSDEIQSTLATLAERDTQLLNLRQEVIKKEEQIITLEDQIASLTQAVDDREMRLNELLTSWSWRITAPMRYGKRLLR
jgi:2-polyprenyl-3-methyl-5-hydroxy-6-metoxy-1,4-benzoquinol methylase